MGTFRKKYAPLSLDSKFMGQFVSIVLVGFSAITSIVMVLLTPFVWPVTWNIIWSQRYYLLGIIVVSLVRYVIDFIVKKILFGPDYVRHRSLVSIYLIYQTLITFVAGFATAFNRVFVALFGLLCSLPQMCWSVAPSSLNELYNIDVAHGTYLAACVAYHTHNNPVLFVTLELLKRSLEDRKLRRKEGVPEEEIRLRARKYAKRWLILMLIRFPHLRLQRKAHLESLRTKYKITGHENLVIFKTEPQVSAPSTELSNAITALVAKKQVLEANQKFMTPDESNQFLLDSVEAVYAEIKHFVNQHKVVDQHGEGELI